MKKILSTLTSIILVLFSANNSQGQLSPVFNKEAVEINFKKDILKNLDILKASPFFPLWETIIRDSRKKAELVPTILLSQKEIDNILCENIPNTATIFVSCGNNLESVVFDDVAQLRLKMAFEVWKNLPNRGLFVEWILSDILVLAVEQNSLSQIEINNSQFVFEDNLIDLYFSKKFLNPKYSDSTKIPLASKINFVPNAVTFDQNGRALSTDVFRELISSSFRLRGSILVERSEFAKVIGSYTFPATLLFMSYSAEYGFPSSPQFFSNDLLSSIFANFRTSQWLAWVELFAVPVDSSPRNIEYWFKVIPLVTKNSEGVSKYLDKDKRPLAKPITESTANFSVVQLEPGSYYSNIIFNGTLGAIPSNQDTRSYVGFTGIEIKAGILINRICGGSKCNLSDLEFGLDLKSPDEKMLSVELVVDKMGQEEIYSYDVKVKSGLNEFKSRSALILTNFQQTFRGSKLNKFYNFNDRVVAYRFFFKRSLNQPFEISGLPVSFNLSTEIKRTDFKKP